MQDAVAFFAIRLIVGIAAVCLRLSQPGQRVVSPYFRIQMLLLLGLAVLYGLAGNGDARWGAAILGTLAFAGSILWTLERRWGGRACLIALFPVAFGMLARDVRSFDLASGSAALLFVSALASAGTLGAAMSAMLLGHRYLTAPGMPLEPLYTANRLLGGSALLRLGASLWALLLGAAAFAQSTYVVWLSLRWLAGIVGPLAVWYLVRRILAYRNTQSATGVLFVGVIFTFIGELTADVLFRATGMPS